jgi:hypothetical protein
MYSESGRCVNSENCVRRSAMMRAIGYFVIVVTMFASGWIYRSLLIRQTYDQGYRDAISEIEGEIYSQSLDTGAELE